MATKKKSSVAQSKKSKPSQSKKKKSSKSNRCWPGFHPVPGKKPFSKGSCAPDKKKTSKKTTKKTSQKKKPIARAKTKK